jgi:integrase
MRSDEARLMKWNQVDFAEGEVRVAESKTEAGERRGISMSAILRAALDQHASWYIQSFGELQGGWYVFPACDRTRAVDPSRPITSFKRAWDGVRNKAGVRCRLHDLRHTLCTKLAEAGVAEAVMLDIMGHVSPVMLKRYSHIRKRARQEAMQAVEARVLSNGIPQEIPKVTAGRPLKVTVTH